MSQCKTLANLHRKMAEVYDFCKGTMLEGREYLCVKYNGNIEHLHPRFNLISTSYEFALCIVEDKPVFAGDILYHEKYGRVTALEFKDHNLFAKQTKSSYPNCGCLGNYSWNPPAPPKPKTVMVELLLEDAQHVLHCLDMYEAPVAIMRAKDAMKPAIKETCK